MRVSRIAAVTLMGAAAFGVSATSAYADYGSSHGMSGHSAWDHPSHEHGRSGEIEASPHAVWPGHVVRFSTEDCHQCGPVRVHVDIDGERHWVKLAKWTPEGKTGWFRVPPDTDPGRYEVEGHCKHGRSIEGSFWVKSRSRWGGHHWMKSEHHWGEHEWGGHHCHHHHGHHHHHESED